MKYTVNYNFKKPEPLDTRNINDINESFDLVDVKLKEVEDSNSNLDATFQSLIINAGSSNAEIVSARRDNVTGVTYDTLPKRLDTVTSQLSEKAPISYIDTKIGTLGSNRRFMGSCTNAELLTKTGMAIDDYWYITDLNTNKCYNGSVWIDIGNNLNVGDKTITLEKTNLLYSYPLMNLCYKITNNLSLINKEVSNTVNEAGYFKFIDDTQLLTNNLTFETNKKYKYAITFQITNSELISTTSQSVYLKFRNSSDMTFVDGGMNTVNLKNGAVTICNELIIPTSYTTFKFAPYIQLTNLGSTSKTLTFKLINIAIIEDNNNYFNSEMFTNYINPVAYPYFSFPTYFDKLYKNSETSAYNTCDLIGDSLTQLTNGHNYQEFLQPMLSTFNFNNYGAGGEKANTISARCGGLKYLIEPCVLTTTGTTVTLLDNRYAEVNIRSSREYEQYYITKDGVEIPIEIQYGSTPYVNPYKIISPYDLTLTKPTLIKTKFMKQDKTGHIAILCLGQNGGFNTEMDLVYQIENIIKYNNYKKYIVLSATMNMDIAIKRQLEYFGEHFLDAKTYMIKYGLTEMGITPTTQDTQDITNNLIPTSLRSDSVHYNDVGCQLLANLIYRKGQELGYW